MKYTSLLILLSVSFLSILFSVNSVTAHGEDANCPHIHSEDTISFLNEISVFNEELKECPIALPKVIGWFYGNSDLLVKVFKEGIGEVSFMVKTSSGSLTEIVRTVLNIDYTVTIK